jgi:hypothetical protein
MMIIRKLLPCLAVVILAGVVLQPFSLADDPPKAEKSKLVSGEDIPQALAKKVAWNFNETPLADIVEFLHNELKIPVRLDIKAINDVGVTPDSPVTFKLSGISAKAALKHLLRDLGLAVTIEEEVLVITTPDVADNNLTTVIYDVSDLPAFRRANGKTAPDYAQLIDILVRTIKPCTWDEVGGPGSIQPFDAADAQALVISQSWEVHEQIQDLLGRLRKLRSGPLGEEEIEKLPPEPSQKPKREGSFGHPGMGGGGGAGMGAGGMTPGGGGPQGEKPATGPADKGPADQKPTRGMGMY